MKREIITTADGSHTVLVPEMNVTYHSKHGAVQESLHVFIEAGLMEAFGKFSNQTVFVFEMGLGTGLNALLTALEAEKLNRKVHYTAVELYPLSVAEAASLNYADPLLNTQSLFQNIHSCAWNEDVLLTENFTFHKQQTDLKNFSNRQPFQVIYYDAFAPGAQPDLWTTEVFKKLYAMFLPGGLLVTYCSKGDVRRAMMAAGFTVKKLPGPPGKREMVRAEKSTLLTTDKGTTNTQSLLL